MAAPLEGVTHEEQRAVIRFLAAEGIKPSEVYRKMSAQYGSSCLNQRNVYKWIKRFKEGRTSIKDEPRQGRPSEVNPPEKQQAVNDLILAERRITVEEISQQLDISTGTAHHIIREVLKFPCWAVAGYLRCSCLSISILGVIDSKFSGNHIIRKGHCTHWYLQFSSQWLSLHMLSRYCLLTYWPTPVHAYFRVWSVFFPSYQLTPIWRRVFTNVIF